jgi:FkbM family methyltransferase
MAKSAAIPFRNAIKRVLSPPLQWAMRSPRLKRAGTRLLARQPVLKARLLRLAQSEAPLDEPRSSPDAAAPRPPAEIIDELAQQPALFGIVCGYDRQDLEVFGHFPPYRGPGKPGYITDFLGNRTAVTFVEGIANQGGTVTSYPIPADFHATALEYIGCLKSVLSARRSFAAMELGAGWGPWLVTAAAAARRMGIGEVHLVGVEAAPSHLEMLRQHLRENGLESSTEIIHGVAADRNGTRHFPELKAPAVQWGGRADDDSLGQLVETPAYTLGHLIGKRFFDLVHIDIQGDEHVVLEASLDSVGARVRRLVIGTHGRPIEARLLALLSEAGWSLEHEQPCVVQVDRPLGIGSIDGCQVWLNPRV